ncbi:nuclear transport factor 2 family protein [Advenella kashmirensis]|uniref:nuclear transport factor 2 family protein n=1 Tax=Advenella kashmirensis TaxID=310575 RepID=UPI0009D99260
MFTDLPDSHWADGRIWVCEDRGFSEWRYSGTMLDGTRVEADGCDLFTFSNGKIAVKDAYRKQS